MLREQEHCEYVLNTSHPDYLSKLASLAEVLDCQLVLDSVGGVLITELLPHLKRQTTLLVYGHLAN